MPLIDVQEGVRECQHEVWEGKDYIAVLGDMERITVDPGYLTVMCSTRSDGVAVQCHTGLEVYNLKGENINSYEANNSMGLSDYGAPDENDPDADGYICIGDGADTNILENLDRLEGGPVKLSIDEIPKSICGGEEVGTVVRTIYNKICGSLTVRLNITKLLTGETEQKTISMSNDKEADNSKINIPVPAAATAGTDRDILSVTAINEENGEVIAEEKLSGDILEPPEPIIDRVEIPDEVCAGKTVSGSTRIINKGCKATLRAVIKSAGERISKSEQFNLGGGDSKDIELPDLTAPSDGLDVTIQVQQKQGDSWRVRDEVTSVINVLTPKFRFGDLSFPNRLQPTQSTTINIPVENIGGCVGEVTIEALNTSESITIEPEDTGSINFEFSMGPVEEENIEVKLLNNITGSIDDSITRTIKAIQAVIIDDSNSIKIFGGFDSAIDYKGSIQGSNIDEQGLEDEDNITPTDRISAIAGSINPREGVDADIIKFNNLQFLFLRFGGELVWIVNNEFKGKSDSLKYSKYPLGFADQLISSEDASLNVKPSITDRINSIGSRIRL